MKEGDFSLEYRRIGAKLLYYRRLKDLSQTELSKMSGLTVAKISYIERGKGSYKFNDILILAKVLDIDYRKLIS